MNILHNELVRKYFGTKHTGCPDGCSFDHFEASSKRVLDAMQRPIRKGERFLTFHYHDGSVIEDFAKVDANSYWNRAGIYLRLPDSFQKQECDHHAYEKRCTLCPYVEIRTDWFELKKPAPSPEKCYVCDNIKNFRPEAVLPVCENHLHNPPRDAVEEKQLIHEIAYGIPGMLNDEGNRMWLEKKLHDLVRIARETK